MDLIRKLYNCTTLYVSMFPRTAYVNYEDFDLGMNKKKNTSFMEVLCERTKYFKDNFNILVRVNTKVDPDNFFRHEQSIPPLLVSLKSQGRGGGRKDVGRSLPFYINDIKFLLF